MTVDGKPVVINGEGGDGLVAGGFPVTIGGPATTPAVGGIEDKECNNVCSATRK